MCEAWPGCSLRSIWNADLNHASGMIQPCATTGPPDTPRGHHYQISHHFAAMADECTQCADHGGYALRRFGDQLVVGLLGGLIPMPGILKRHDLRFTSLALFLLEQHIVVASASVERSRCLCYVLKIRLGQC